jgi:hypothetical protein
MDDRPVTTISCHRHQVSRPRTTMLYNRVQAFEPPGLPVQDTTSNQFTLFPELPTEIRIKIWKAFRRPGRVMCLYYTQRARDLQTNLPRNPVGLQVNRESRHT